MASAPPSPLPDYADFAAALQRCGLAQSPAELHGFALGMRVGGVAQARTLWSDELYSSFDPADVLAGECRDLLDRLFAEVFTDDAGEPIQLTLLLPQDIVVDSARLHAVRDWCRGFLFGYGLGGERVARRLSAPARELLGDISEFTRLDTEQADNSAENQAALIEIEEYLREGVMLLRDELTGAQGSDESD